MAIYSETPLDLASQVKLLEKRGLIIEDKAWAENKLKNINFYRLANYWRTMEADKIKHIFKNGSRFSEVIEMYDFDLRLRELVFDAIQVIEVSLRSKVIQSFSMRYGAFWFDDEQLFKDRKQFLHCLKSIDVELSRTKEDFIKEYYAQYTSPLRPPVWKTLEVVSFGNLSKLYCNFADNTAKKEVAKDMGLPQHLFLESWIKSISVLRNACAHHSRIWNRAFSVKPQMPERLPMAWLNNQGDGSNKIYSLLACITYLMNVIDPENTFPADIKALMHYYRKIDTAAMGFPQSWQLEPLWQ